MSSIVACVLDGSEYAIQRGLQSLDIPLSSDIDIVVTKASAVHMIDLAKEKKLLIHLTESYGGARLYVAGRGSNAKRIDLMWECHYRGIPLLDLSPIIKRRALDGGSGLYSVSEPDLASIVYFIKNAYGGADRYACLLEKYGYSVLSNRRRVKFILASFLKKPVRSCCGLARVAYLYARRIISPSGLTVTGKGNDFLARSEIINYLFPGKIQPCRFPVWVYRARIASALCILAQGRHAQVDLSMCASLRECERQILRELRRRVYA
jgi:hypothetical protein